MYCRSPWWRRTIPSLDINNETHNYGVKGKSQKTLWKTKVHLRVFCCEAKALVKVRFLCYYEWIYKNKHVWASNLSNKIIHL